MTSVLGKRLVVAGAIGYDIYLADGGQVYVRPGGSAYRSACSVLTVQGQALVVATTGRAFNREFLKKFDKTEIQIVDQLVQKGPDHVFLFDLCNGASGPPRVSLGQPSAPPIDYLEQTPFRDLHVHLGGMPPAELAGVLAGARRARPTASLSCSLSACLLSGDPEGVLGPARECALVFLSLEAFRLLRTRGRLADLLAGRLAVVTCGEAGAVCFADGIPVFAHSPEPRETVCGVGAGDVLAGAFLSTLLRYRELSRAARVGVEVAAASMVDFGVEETLRVRHSIPALEAKAQGRTPRLPLLEPASFEPDRLPAYESVVEATGLFVIRDRRLLLVEKPVAKAFVPGVLYVPGGKLEAGESPAQCAARELKEETGLEGGQLEPLGVFYYPDPRGTGRLYRFYQFLITGTVGDPCPSDDVSTCHWYPLDELSRDQVFELTWAQLFLSRLLRPL